MKLRMGFFKEVLDHLMTAVVVLDAELRVRFINSAAEDLLHTSSSHALGQPLCELILKGEAIMESLRGALAHQQPYTEREATIRLPDNVTHIVDFTVNIRHSPQGVPSLLLELQTLDRFHRINRDDESVARQETARHLIRGLAHEVKNPLGGIRGAAQLLERELDSEDLKEYTGVIISEADRLKELVDRMLGPQRQLTISPVNLLKVLEYVIQLVEAERPGAITWTRDYDPSLPPIEADEVQIVQALMNIVRNACEALKDTDEPRIQLRSRAVRQFTIGTIRHRLVMQLDVTDNGPGVEPELLERIFFPMISGRADGTGLGLAITQNVISQHRGCIQVSSRPGNTCFSIYLPFTYEPHTTKEAHGK